MHTLLTLQVNLYSFCATKGPGISTEALIVRVCSGSSTGRVTQLSMLPVNYPLGGQLLNASLLLATIDRDTCRGQVLYVYLPGPYQVARKCFVRPAKQTCDQRAIPNVRQKDVRETVASQIACSASLNYRWRTGLLRSSICREHRALATSRYHCAHIVRIEGLSGSRILNDLCACRPDLT